MKRRDTLGYYEDPLERRIYDALTTAGIAFVQEEDPAAHALDFLLPGQDVHIEVKAYHADRISKQMARVPFCIAVQGEKAVHWLASLIERAA